MSTAEFWKIYFTVEMEAQYNEKNLTKRVQELQPHNDSVFLEYIGENVNENL